MAVFWAMMAAYSNVWPSVFLKGAPETAVCDSQRPLRNPFWESLWRCAYTVLQAAHSLVWLGINDPMVISVHHHMRASASIDFNGYSLRFFNLKQVFLWYVSWVALSDQYPDNVLVLIA